MDKDTVQDVVTIEIRHDVDKIEQPSHRIEDATVKSNQTKIKSQKKYGVLKALSVLGVMYNTTVTGFNRGSMNIIFLAVIEKFNTTRTQASVLLSLYYLLGPAIAIVHAQLMNTFGVGKCMVVGGLIGSIGFVGASLSPYLSMSIGFMGVLSASSRLILYMGSLTVPTDIIASVKGRIIVTLLLTCTMGVGDAVGSPVMAWLFEQTGYTSALMVLGALYLQTCVGNMIIWSLLNKRSKKGNTQAQRCRRQLPSLLKNVRFVLFLIVDIFRSAYGTVFANMQVDNAATIGFDLASATLFASLSGVAGLIGRFLNGLVVRFKCWHTIHHYSIMLVLFGAFMTALAFANTYPAMLSVSCGIGLLIGPMKEFFFVLLHEIVTTEEYRLAASVELTIYGLSGFAFAPAAGWIRDVTGSYSLLFYVALPISIFMASIFSGYHVSKKCKSSGSWKLEQHNSQVDTVSTIG